MSSARSLPLREVSRLDSPVSEYVRCHLYCYLIALIVGLGGCSSGKHSTYQVTGTVKTPDSTPLAGGRILFRPEGETVVAAKGDIREDGSFELSTYGLGDGAIAGDHRVMVLPPVPQGFMDEPRKTPGTKLAIDLSYQSLRTTPLKYTVKPGAENHFDIVVEPLKVRKK